jgi:S1-C subfamily serine protease
MSEPFTQYPYGEYPIPEPPRRRRGRHGLGLTATAVIALAAGAGVGVVLTGGSSPGGATATSKTMLSTSQIAERLDPGVVDVTSTLGYQNATAKGTGIVLTSNGEILTNNHVVEGATSISVTDIGNGKAYKATVVGYDESQDVAVLQLSGASGLTTATTGNSSTVQQGDKVVALGNAGGVGGTPSVAAGTVTALNQSITASDEASGTSEQLSGMIQTDADIQSGDSGGPLVNEYGQVIGMDTAASSGFQFGNGYNGGYGYGGDGYGSSNSGQGSATQGYSIPINTALAVASQIQAGHASSTVHIGSTAFLGVEIANTTNSSLNTGVQIAGAAAGTPAAKDGLGAGDVITSVAGQTVSSGTSIQQVLEKYHPGDKVGITWTDSTGQARTSTVTLANGPAA